MPLPEMPIRQDPRPGSRDTDHRTDYDAARGGWTKPTAPPAPPAPSPGTR